MFQGSEMSPIDLDYVFLSCYFSTQPHDPEPFSKAVNTRELETLYYIRTSKYLYVSLELIFYYL
jgi:hypothetical protein